MRVALNLALCLSIAVVTSAADSPKAPQPAHPFEIYLLPNSHVDIGYTKLQTEVELDQCRFLELAIEAAQKTADYPPEARFKWNSEVLWAVDSYLRQATPEKRDAFIEAVKKGWIGLDALYANEMAGLCRPEELVQLLDEARRLRKTYDIPIETAMLTDVPGQTWGAVPVLAQSGVRYLSLGPNANHRIGYTCDAWDGRPFYWVSPSGLERILCWQTNHGYDSPFKDEAGLQAFMEQFDAQRAQYPYDILYFRFCKGDNAGPDTGLSDFVKAWNKKHASPRLIIATTRELFRAFEARYGDAIPSARGDFSPYWEDGAASTARELALNRGAAERTVQAETLWALLNPTKFPADAFREAWRNILLFDEHTWGAQSYVTRGKYPPGSEGYEAQWKIKQSFALNADAQSCELLADALSEHRTAGESVSAVDVFNTTSWARSDLLILPVDMHLRGDVVQDAEGREAPSQRLSTGELAVWVEEVPAFGAKRLTFAQGKPRAFGQATADGSALSNGMISVVLDAITGGVKQFRWDPMGVDFAHSGDVGLNEFFYVPGFDPKAAVRNGPVILRVKEAGPLVASIVVESPAPGCNQLSRELRVIHGVPRLDIVDAVDKKPIPLADLLKPEPQYEGFYFGFAFNVPDGVMRMDMPWCVVRPEVDQLPGSCKNWFTIQRWVDIANQDYGVTWATVDAPIVEVGAISPQPPTPSDKDIWRKSLPPSQTLYSYVMNNYWTTNYRHDQDGVLVFRYSITPHRRFDATAAAKFGVEQSQPLITVPVEDKTPPPIPLLKVEPPTVLVTALKPSDDGKAWILRLFGASGMPEKVTLTRCGDKQVSICRSNLDEAALDPVTGPLDLLPYEIVTLRLTPGV
jgi:hypothetical protein